MLVYVNDTAVHRVVIIGGGFGGLYAAKKLDASNIDVTLIDRRNHHVFQPLLYQVATGGLSPGDISSPLRGILKKQRRTRVWQANAVDIDCDAREVVLEDGRAAYDTLIVSTGVSHAYFGHDDWERHAPGLKTIEDALAMRSRILLAFEKAEREPDAERRRRLMTFVIAGGGATGVELAGAIAELARATLKHDFRRIDPANSRIVLVEGKGRVLPTYPESLSEAAQRSLQRLGVEVRTDTFVTDIDAREVTVERDEQRETIEAETILWAAGVKASEMGEIIARCAGAELDNAGRVMVRADLTVPGRPEIFVIGDLANVRQGGEQLPGVAPVAMQQGEYVARAIRQRLDKRTDVGPFRYSSKGSLAVIGRNAAVADFGRLRFNGYPAWLAWVLVHIWYLIEFDSKLIVLIQWATDYLTRKRGARLVTGDDPQPLVPAGKRGGEAKS